jgi:hypothetical protein
VAEDQRTAPASVDRRFDESLVATTDLGILASKALRALNRASRACLLYDFDNDAVADFLRELELRMELLLAHGPLRMEVRPWELVRDGEVVYREQDREKSLAFRLYYDGVRRLTIHPEVSWEEITRLVEILSIRYTGIRQQEEDVVTLLWKADLEHVEISSVEGYTPTDDESPEDVRSPAHRRPRSDLLATLRDHHLPRPEIAEAVDVDYRRIPPDRLDDIRAEEAQIALPDLCLRLVDRLMATLVDADDPIEPELCTPLIRDVRDFLLAEQEDPKLLEAVRLVQRVAETLEDSAARASLLAVFTEREAFARMVDAAVATGQLPKALVEVMSVAPIDELEELLKVLASRWSEEGEKLVKQLLATSLGSRIHQLGDVTLQSPASVAAELLQVAADRDPGFATLLAVAMMRRQDRTCRLKALEVLKVVPYRSEVGRVLIDVGLSSKDPEVAARSAEVLAANGEQRAFLALTRAIQSGLESGVRISHLEPLADALTTLDASRAASQFNQWIRPDKLLQRARAQPGPLWHLAVRSLTGVPGDLVGDLLRWIHSRADGELKMRCIQAMALQKELEKSE